jgi:hypothetical protein
LAAVVLVVALAGSAAGSAGDPVLAGKPNGAGFKVTTLTSKSNAETLHVTDTGAGGGILSESKNKNSYSVTASNNAGANGGGGAVMGAAQFNNAVVGFTGDDSAVGVGGVNLATGVFGGAGVEGVGGVGVFGIGFPSISGSPYGVYGATSVGTGTYGISSDLTGVGVWGENSGGGLGGFFDSYGGTGQALYVAGDMTVTGAKTGFVADYAVNGSSATLHQGDSVTVIGVRPPIVGEIPLLVVAPAAAGDPVIGIVDRAMTPSTVALPESRPSVGLSARGSGLEPSGARFEVPVRTGGPSSVTVFSGAGTDVAPGGYLDVVTLGAYSYASVSAAAGPIRAGDRLTPGTDPGTLVAAKPITAGGQSFYAPGTSVGYALGRLNDGTGRIAVFVSPQ